MKVKERDIKDHYLVAGDFAFDYVSIDYELMIKVVYLPDTSLYAIHHDELWYDEAPIENTMPDALTEQYMPLLKRYDNLLRIAGDYFAIPWDKLRFEM